ncbi:sulfur carrier protein ThiS [Cryobacterium fucosi]|uniref:Sulfur carrier protein ThiS n=1 Tax=Cryobacterium fucosi TaxID=1259157 RepID=A0A4R9BGZ0_9MICO|nr:sulfur carrier protein ThiS [Cryobacterium fucosi]
MTLNGAVRSFTPGETVSDLVGELTGRRIAADGQAVDRERLGVAVALNVSVVPRSHWATTTLRPGDSIEIVTAAQGG